jgi:peptide/nickel transport system substrate-binding protein
LTKEENVSRRKFISGTVGGLVVGAAVGAAAGYSLVPPAAVGPAVTVTTTTTVKETTTPMAKQVLGHSTFLDPTTMDPHKVFDEPTMRFTANLYDTLIKIAGIPGSWIQLEPSVAMSWDVSSDGKQYTFNLRRGIKFHDGSTLDAKAVKYSFDRALAINQGFTAPAVKSFVSSTEVLGDYQVGVKLSTAFSPFLSAIPTLYIVSPTSVEANVKSGDYGTAWLETHDAGSGPYVLTERRPGELTVYERFPGFWGGWGPQYFDELRYEFVGEVGTLVSKLRTGESDWGEYWLPEDSFVELAQPGSGCTVPQWADTAGTFTWLVNNQNQFLKNKLVRQAMSYAFDYETCLKDIWKGGGVPSPGPIPPGMLGYNPAVPMYKRDLTKAKALMDQSGFKAGEITIDATWGTGQETRRLMAILMQQNFAEIGINLELKELPWATWVEQIATQDPKDVIALSPLAGSIAFPDPDDILTRFYYSPLWEKENVKTYYTCSFYKNKDVDALIEKGRVAAAAEREAIYKDATRMIIEDAASIWPIWNYTKLVIRSDIEGFRPLPFYFTNAEIFRRNNWFRVKS